MSMPSTFYHHPSVKSVHTSYVYQLMFERDISEKRRHLCLIYFSVIYNKTESVQVVK